MARRKTCPSQADGNGVTLGRGSEVVDGAVSVGADGAERQVKQVADAVEDDDLVNMRQFRSLTGVSLFRRRG